MNHDEAQTIMRHFDVVAEGLSKDIQRVAEGHGILVEKIDGLGVRMDRIEVRMDGLEVNMSGLNTRMDGLETRMDGLEVNMSGLNTRMDGLEVNMSGLNTRMDGLDTRMDGLDSKLDGFIVETRTNFSELRAAIKFSYAELDRRVGHLESAVLDLADRVQRIEARQTP